MLLDQSDSEHSEGRMAPSSHTLGSRGDFVGPANLKLDMWRLRVCAPGNLGLQTHVGKERVWGRKGGAGWVSPLRAGQGYF